MLLQIKKKMLTNQRLKTTSELTELWLSLEKFSTDSKVIF